jgi:imidazolonepropionase-like amidohydrolase
MKLRLIGMRLLLLLTAVIPAPGPQAYSQKSPTPLVIAHANLIDGLSAHPVRDATVIVRDGKIDTVATGPVELPAGATVLDLKGRWLLPGLIDAHVHLRELSAARTALASGVTTARSLGVERFTDVGIRELNHEGIADLPDVVAAGYGITTPPNELFLLDFPKMNDLAEGVDGTESVRRMVRALAGRGVNVIKVLATGRAGLPQSEPRRRMFTDEELAAITDEARKVGIPVAAHAHGDEGAAGAVRAGVRSIEHGTYLSDRTLSLMKGGGIYLVPTLSFTTGYAATGGTEKSPVVMARARAMAPRLRETAARAWKLGVRIVAGSDAQYDDERRLQDELAELVQNGMAPMDAIKAATSVAADCLMIGGRTGSVKPGLEADLIAVDTDPLADINALRDVLLVINNGTVVVNRLSF